MMDEWVNLKRKIKVKKVEEKNWIKQQRGTVVGKKKSTTAGEKKVAEKRSVRKKKRKKLSVVSFSSPSWACPSSSPQTLRSAWPSSTSSSPQVAPLELRLGQHAPAR